MPSDTVKAESAKWRAIVMEPAPADHALADLLPRQTNLDLGESTLCAARRSKPHEVSNRATPRSSIESAHFADAFIGGGSRAIRVRGCAASARTACSIRGRPQSGRYCLGISFPMREPEPAAGIRATNRGMGGILANPARPHGFSAGPARPGDFREPFPPGQLYTGQTGITPG